MTVRLYLPLFLLSFLPLSACPGSPTTFKAPVNNQTSNQQYYLPLNLGNHQDIHVDMHIQDTNIQGELIVGSGGMQTHLFTRTFSTGRYRFSGSFSPPRGFSMSGVFPEPFGAFSLTGVLPTQTDPGNFSFTQGGETVSDTLPALNTLPSPPPQPSPMPSTSPFATASPSTELSPSPTPMVAKQWTAEELTKIRTCFSSRTAAYQGSDRTLVIQTSAKITANVALVTNPDTPWNAAQRQAKLNEAGEFALNSETQLGTDCIP